jgi:hypothetical protein
VVNHFASLALETNYTDSGEKPVIFNRVEPQAEPVFKNPPQPLQIAERAFEEPNPSSLVPSSQPIRSRNITQEDSIVRGGHESLVSNVDTHHHESVDIGPHSKDGEQIAPIKETVNDAPEDDAWFKGEGINDVPNSEDDAKLDAEEDVDGGPNLESDAKLGAEEFVKPGAEEGAAEDSKADVETGAIEEIELGAQRDINMTTKKIRKQKWHSMTT